MNDSVNIKFIKPEIIKQKSDLLLSKFFSGKKIIAPIPVDEIVEFLDYDLDFRNDGIYEDKNILGGLIFDDKRIEINETLIKNEGRLNFTIAHEIGHIILHVPIYDNKSEILCRKDEGEYSDKKQPVEVQADMFAANLIMPDKLVKRAFFKSFKHPVNVSKKSLIEFFIKRSAKSKAYNISRKV